MNGRTRLLLPALTLWQRDIVRFVRQRNRITGALVTPFVFWLLLGSGFAASFRLPSGTEMAYLEYFFPGTVIMIMLFTAIFSTISIIEDRREGFLQSVLVAPVSPGAIVLGKFLGGATLAAGQGALFLFIAPFAGLKIPWESVPVLLPTFFLVGFGLTGFGFLVAWPMRSTQGFHAIMNLLMMPLWVLSGAVFPIAQSNPWIYWFARINPVTYGVAAVRHALYEGDPGIAHLPSLAVSLGVSVGFATVTYVLAYRMVKSRRKITG